ncbi:MAG: hypothetical protein HXX13_03235 [Bacteroidetes bacterium]|nr:hypothetical protein [Bacteroidota bacterium]
MLTSCHDDYREMLFCLKCQDPNQIKNIFLVHGEYEAQSFYAGKLKDAGFGRILIPERGEEVVIG